MAYTPAELEGADLVQLLTPTVDGRVYRFASVDVDVSDGSQTLSYREGLAVDSYVDAIAAPGESLEEPSASAEVTFTDDTAEGWSVLAAGADQADAVAELAPPAREKGTFLLGAAEPVLGITYRPRMGKTSLGRDEGCDVVIKDRTVSSRHAEIVLRPEGATITNLMATNGTRVNGREIQSAQLSDGDANVDLSDYERPFHQILAEVEEELTWGEWTDWVEIDDEPN